jgi:hypothetical protein
MVVIVPAARAAEALRLTKGIAIGSVVPGAKDVVIE